MCDANPRIEGTKPPNFDLPVLNFWRHQGGVEEIGTKMHRTPTNWYKCLIQIPQNMPNLGVFGMTHFHKYARFARPAHPSDQLVYSGISISAAHSLSLKQLTIYIILTLSTWVCISRHFFRSPASSSSYSDCYNSYPLYFSQIVTGRRTHCTPWNKGLYNMDLTGTTPNAHMVLPLDALTTIPVIRTWNIYQVSMQRLRLIHAVITKLDVYRQRAILEEARREILNDSDQSECRWPW